MPIHKFGTPLKFSEIVAEFGIGPKKSFGDYYAGGTQVPAGTVGEFGPIPSSGPLNFKKFYDAASTLVADWLIVGGGGGGAGSYGAEAQGGGGAGGYFAAKNQKLKGTYTVKVGRGGLGGTGESWHTGNDAAVAGKPGTDSSINTWVAHGGQGGLCVTWTSDGQNLGGDDRRGGESGGSNGQGSNGGSGPGGGWDGSGGGGGAGGPGERAQKPNATGERSGGNGGPGITWLDGIGYAGGGGGAAGGHGYYEAQGGKGTHGGGDGGSSSPVSLPPTNGIRGGGGGGGRGMSGSRHPVDNGGNGGDGIVVFRYPGTVARATGGTVVITGGYVYHTFTSDGTFVV